MVPTNPFLSFFPAPTAYQPLSEPPALSVFITREEVARSLADLAIATSFRGLFQKAQRTRITKKSNLVTLTSPLPSYPTSPLLAAANFLRLMPILAARRTTEVAVLKPPLTQTDST